MKTQTDLNKKVKFLVIHQAQDLHYNKLEIRASIDTLKPSVIDKVKTTENEWTSQKENRLF